MSQKVAKETVAITPYIILNNQGEIKQFELDDEQHVLGRDPRKADLLVPAEWVMVSRMQATFRKEGANYRIYDGDGQTPSSNRIFINHSLISLSDGLLLTDGSKIQISQHANSLLEIRYFNPAQSSVAVTPSHSRIFIKDRSIVIGRESNANMVLDSPMVSRIHATIDIEKSRYVIYDHSKNGTFVNETQVRNKLVLSENDKIRIGPYILIFRKHYLDLIDRGTHIRLDAQNLILETGKKRRIDNLSFAIEPGQLVALVGGSGAGKSTLMRTLLGIEKLTTGVVYINGENLQENFNLYRNQIGYVPQDDIIHLDLSVIEVLTYAARLRLPEDVNLKQIVEEALEAVEMTKFRDNLITQLSGGQRKRVSIAVELLADPKLFFLDEPTSGLDPGLDKKMMQLLQKLAHDGTRTIILVTHATANITACDRIVFLGSGGKLCYFGTPQDALHFFEVGDFSDIYNKLEQPYHIKQCVENFLKSSYYQKYIANQLDFSEEEGRKQKPEQKKVGFWQQLPLLTERCYQLTLRDRVNLSLSLLTAPVAIILVWIASRSQDPFLLDESDPSLASIALRVLFVFTCAGLWVGFSSSLQEIVKESGIYLRERLVNLGLFAYLGSKVVTLVGLGVVQSLLIVVVVLLGFKEPVDNSFIAWSLGLWINSFMTLFSSFCLGLLVSALVKNSSQANGALPLLILPQTIFAGVLFKTEGAMSKVLSWLTISRWSVGGYGTIVDINGLIPKPVQLPDGSMIPQVFSPTSVYEPNWENLSLNWGMLLLHGLVYLTLTFWIQKQKDIFS